MFLEGPLLCAGLLSARSRISSSRVFNCQVLLSHSSQKHEIFSDESVSFRLNLSLFCTENMFWQDRILFFLPVPFVSPSLGSGDLVSLGVCPAVLWSASSTWEQSGLWCGHSGHPRDKLGSNLTHYFFIQYWASYLTTVHLSFSICKIEIKIKHTSQGCYFISIMCLENRHHESVDKVNTPDCQVCEKD